MVNLLFAEDDQALHQPGIVRTMYDPACGTGGMLSVAEDYLARLNPQARLQVYGQELNDESYAICKADMLVKGQAADNIKCGNSFNADGLPGLRADYLISNPPFGVDWSKAEKAVRDEHEHQGFAGRFGPGLPRKNDGSLLFLLHMLSKMKPAEQGGSRLAIVFNGSPLFTGSADSGESDIRRWIIENDWLEAIVALPDQMFYNTGISTYIWLVTNRKAPERKGKVQLINGVGHFRKMRKSLGNKRKELGSEDIDQLTRLYADFCEGPRSRSSTTPTSASTASPSSAPSSSTSRPAPSASPGWRRRRPGRAWSPARRRAPQPRPRSRLARPPSRPSSASSSPSPTP